MNILRSLILRTLAERIKHLLFFNFKLGFDAISTTGEEVIHPKKNIPLAIFITLVISSLLYCSLSSVITLMMPYYMTEADIALPQAFEYVNLNWAKYLVSIGAIFSLASCLYSQMFPLPRIVYSMASDGLIFKWLARLLPRFKTPFVASISTGLFAGALACIFDLQELVEMMSIGTLMAYTMVSICVIILRYRNETSDNYESSSSNNGESLMRKFFLSNKAKPNAFSSRLVNWLTLACIIYIVFICLILSRGDLTRWHTITTVSILVVMLLAFSVLIWRQPQNTNITTFKVRIETNLNIYI